MLAVGEPQKPQTSTNQYALDQHATCSSPRCRYPIRVGGERSGALNKQNQVGRTCNVSPWHPHRAGYYRTSRALRTVTFGGSLCFRVQTHPTLISDLTHASKRHIDLHSRADCVVHRSAALQCRTRVHRSAAFQCPSSLSTRAPHPQSLVRCDMVYITISERRPSDPFGRITSSARLRRSTRSKPCPSRASVA